MEDDADAEDYRHEVLAGHIETFHVTHPRSPDAVYTRTPYDNLKGFFPGQEPALRRAADWAIPIGNVPDAGDNESPQITFRGSTSRPSTAPTESKSTMIVKEAQKKLEHHKYFLQSAAWFSVQAIIISFFTADILDSILEWRSGFEVFILMIAVTVLWWYVVQDPLINFIVSEFDKDSQWDRGVKSGVQIVTTSLVIMTFQYASRILSDSWNAQSFSPTDRIAQIFVIALYIGDIIFNVVQAEKLRDYDQRDGKK